MRIPSGQVTTYSEIAHAVGSPKGRAGCWNGDWEKPDQLDHPLPPSASEIGRT